ncbi:Trypsin [Poriferisphaera corsica]|uniref:Trypsin n=1 Tax=Poriferisphaera corsica TaxID=2528020 RepID=A0A517YX42_9BACT|nr:PEP-CTERM sorting domain-containing protein [Poriferisphaera corsica]QDU34789.1 Trypsin [Poriferisphaera corsica]
MNKIKRRTFGAAAITAFVVSAMLAPTAGAATLLNGNYDVHHLERAQESEYNHVAQVLQYDTTDGILVPARTRSTGIVIADQWLLTAAHNVTDPQLPDSLETAYYEIRVGNQTYVADRWYTPRTWSYEPYFGDDIALVHIGGNQIFDPTITRANLNQGSFIRDASGNLILDSAGNAQFTGYAEVDPNGQTFETVGYGLTDFAQEGDGITFDTEFGTKRYYSNRFDLNHGDDAILAPFVGIGQATNMLYSDMDVDVDAEHASDIVNGEDFDWDKDYWQVLEGLGAPGDSGAANYRGGKVVGISSQRIQGASAQNDSHYVDVMVSTDVARWSAWIDQVMNGTYDDPTSGLGAREGSIFNEIAFDTNEEWTFIKVPGYNSFEEYAQDQYYSEAGRYFESAEEYVSYKGYASVSDFIADRGFDSIADYNQDYINQMLIESGNEDLIKLIQDMDGMYLAGDRQATGENGGISFSVEELKSLYPDVDWDSVFVPEPTSLSLLSLAGLAMLRRRK